MAIDKDVLIKHRFWVMLAAGTLFALVAIFFLLTVVSSTIAANRKQLDDAIKAIKVPTDAKNEKTVEIVKEEAGKFIKKKDEAWAKGWSEQEKLFTWPK